MRRRVKRPTKGLRIYNRDLPGSASRFPPNAEKMFTDRVQRVEMARRFFCKKINDDLRSRRSG
jgi:hypothetical protein